MIKGFKMKLYPGMEEEYERRHNLLWPEMKDISGWESGMSRGLEV